jgi:hypothetical protein
VLFEKQNGVFAIALGAEPTIWNHFLAQVKDMSFFALTRNLSV